MRPMLRIPEAASKRALRWMRDSYSRPQAEPSSQRMATDRMLQRIIQDLLAGVDALESADHQDNANAREPA